ncbi:TRAP transporter substrate-binding protein DctP [Kushneria marisflavi]|uniref:C4-dicarboxylate ABC transporter substrate-binding protein n=1 Tax=Kushneria marisflavi TaxID=157779 RepID=A0A240UM77_9GAMM|nr:TRAP transporter substrate-binding protein DctP [Kushneria marisflavi]ART62607.1 C4-dicarboxylate ABC transporter substrate-binding protein [Kushneria marisflavi]RKD84007.1 TRAP-type C4-dicarboxylate transport system substrate-binding protein [Kushneria marisflavi]
MQIRNVVTGVFALSMMGAATSALADTWRFGLEETEGSVQYAYAEAFKDLIEEKSDGDITVQILPYGVWGSNYSALYDALQSGAIPISFGSGFLGGTVPESQLMSLNYVMPNDQLETAEILNSDAFMQSDAWQQSFRSRGLVPLAAVPEGFQVWTANKEIRTPEDMKGLQIRVMDNSLLRATYQAYGAAPITIAYGELYSALQQGQAEGNIQPVFAHENMGFYEVQDYMIFAEQAQFIGNLIANQDWYEALPDDQQEMLQSTLDEMVQKGNDIQTQFNAERLETIKDNSDIKIIHLDEQERSRFRELARPVRQVYVDMVGERGKQALDILLKQVEESKSGSSDNDSGHQSS